MKDQNMYKTPEYDALRREYLENATARAAYLREAVGRLRTGDPVDLKELRQVIHKLRGSGGFFGYRQLSEAAGRAEDTIVLTLDGELERDDQQIAGLVEQLLGAIEAAASQAES